MKGIPAFNLDGGELYMLAKNIYQLSFNDLSPFQGMPGGGIKLSQEAQELAKDADLKASAAVLAQPDLKLSLHRGGSTIPFEVSSLYIKKVRTGYHTVYLQQDGLLLSVVFFDSIPKYCEFFAAQNAASVTIQPVNLLKAPMQLENLVFVFNLADCYRRAYLNNLLQDASELVEAIYEDEFIAILEKELKSKDVRWLLPSLLTLVPGMEKFRLEFSGEQLELAEAMDFVSRGKNPRDKRPIYYLGSAGKYMGLEFTLFWKHAVGFEVTGINKTSGKITSLGSYYFAPTAEANHFLSIKPGDGESAKCTHEALTTAHTAHYLQKILEEKLD